MASKVLKPEATAGGATPESRAHIELESKRPRMLGATERVPPPLKMWEQEGKTISLATTHPFNTTLVPTRNEDDVQREAALILLS